MPGANELVWGGGHPTCDEPVVDIMPGTAGRMQGFRQSFPRS